MNDRLEAAFQDRQPGAEKSLQSRSERMGPSGVQLTTRAQFFREAVDEHQLLKLGDNLQRQYVPPIDSPLIHHATCTELQELPEPMEILDLFGDLVQAEHRTAGLMAPAFVGGRRGTRKINDQIPTLCQSRQRKRVVGVEQQDFQPCPPPAGTRPSIRLTLCSRSGEDLMAAAT